MATIREALAVALAHQRAGRLAAAEQIYRQILAADPDQPDAWHLLGVVAHETGRYETAVECIGRGIAGSATNPAFHNNLGNAYTRLARWEDAVACYGRAVALRPAFVEAHYNLGLALQEQGRMREAIAAYRRTVQLRPEFARAYFNLGNALYSSGDVDGCVAALRRAIELDPADAEACHNLGHALLGSGRTGEALVLYRRAIALHPGCAEAHTHLGVALNDQGELDEAIACHRRALELRPAYAEACNNLANALKDEGWLDESLACYRQALELQPDWASVRSNMLCALQYRGGVTLSALAQAHAEFDRRHAQPSRGTLAEAAGGARPARPLRVGFVSRDLGRHPVGYFLAGVLKNLPWREIETFCYSDRPAAADDALTEGLRAAATQWRDVFGASDQRLAQQIQADRIDILFDLAGHTAHNRLPLFARKPAPIQVTWAGYVGTTGLGAMDYILADRHEIPPAAERYYRERVLRMPDGYVCYDPPAAAPPVSPPPAVGRGFPVFGSFNNPIKIGPGVVAVWAAILRRLPAARLRLQFRSMDQPGIVRRLTEAFAGEGIDAARVELKGWAPQAELLAAYSAVDVALDPFPFGGGVTTCEALWMGVPVVTCPGETFAGRHALSHLSNVGLTETIAGDLDEYVEIAVSLASDLPRLAALRARLRPQMAASPLCDGPRFAANLAELLRDVWRRGGKDEG